MAITVSVPARVGPGYVCFYSGLAGPTPLDDVFQIAIRESGGGNFLTAGVKLVAGGTAGTIVLGETNAFAISPGVDRYIAPGAAVQAEWAQLHASFAVVDSGVITGLVWDPTGAAFVLIQQLLQRPALSSTAMADILAAVRHTFPATP